MTSLYSHSQLQTFEQCPKKYDFQYVNRVKVPRRQSAPTYLGSAVHAVVEKLYRNGSDGVLIPLDEAIRLYEAEWEQVDHDRLVALSDFHTIDDYIRMGREMLVGHYERYQPFKHGKLLGVELNLTFDLPRYGYKFRAKIDRLWKRDDGVVEICDYKTGQTLPRLSDPTFDSQMGIYLLAVKDKYPDFGEIDLAVYSLKHDEVIRHRMSEDEQDMLIEDLRNQVVAIGEARRLNNFPARESGLCRFCDWLEVCPAKRHKKQLEEAESDSRSEAERLRDLVDQFLEKNEQLKELSKEVEALKANLKDTAEATGLQKFAGTKRDVTVKLTTAEKFITKTKDKAAFANLNFLVRQLELDDYLTVDTTALMKEIYAARRLPEEDLEKLRQFVVETTTGRVSGRIREEGE